LCENGVNPEALAVGLLVSALILGSHPGIKAGSEHSKWTVGDLLNLSYLCA
jgi:hypothetical protein